MRDIIAEVLITTEAWKLYWLDYAQEESKGKGKFVHILIIISSLNFKSE